MSRARARAGLGGHPSLRLILLLVNLVILAVPISGLYLFEIYENELVGQTESELISQAALVGAMFRDEAVKLGGPDYGLAHWNNPNQSETDLRIVPTMLNRSSSPIHQEPLTYSASGRAPDPVALDAAKRLAPVIKEATLTTLSTIAILDFHGLIVGDGRGQGLSMDRNPEVAKALEGNYASILRVRRVSGSSSLDSPSRDTPYRVFVAFPVFNGQRLVGVIYLSRTPRQLSKALYRERHTLAWAGASVLALMVVISLSASLLIIGPVKKLAREARIAAEEGGRSVRRKAKGDLFVVREVAELRADVSDMAERLSRRSDYLKAFAAGVSHEFKTPLAAIKGAMEIIGEHGRDMDPATFGKFADNVRLDLERLERLVARLLALARAEALSPKGDETTEAAGLLAGLSERLGALHPGFTVKVGPGPESLWLAMDRDVLETVLVNLLDNARENGATSATLTLSATDGKGAVRVEDDGPGLREGEESKIFEPFYTGRKNQGGTGLGLSLARTLLSPYQGQLEFLGRPAVFLVTAPLAQAPPTQGHAAQAHAAKAPPDKTPQNKA
ncbi:MAG: HAMP domain-containing histidine kinase [Deltaproteobacteria bacterium]|jgi:signal transduction histidine kinase|nr:HAMP domain-containing histidine kinase [Deltaproteobacteria bacterium]